MWATVKNCCCCSTKEMRSMMTSSSPRAADNLSITACGVRSPVYNSSSLPRRSCSWSSVLMSVVSTSVSAVASVFFCLAAASRACESTLIGSSSSTIVYHYKRRTYSFCLLKQRPPLRILWILFGAIREYLFGTFLERVHADEGHGDETGRKGLPIRKRMDDQTLIAEIGRMAVFLGIK